MMSFKQAEKLFSTARNKYRGKPLMNNTRLIKIDDDTYGVKLHNTVVVTINKNGTYELNTGGWFTPLTKDRIKIYSLVKLYSQWIIFYRGLEFNFKDDIIINKFGMPINLDEKEVYEKIFQLEIEINRKGSRKELNEKRLDKIKRLKSLLPKVCKKGIKITSKEKADLKASLQSAEMERIKEKKELNKMFPPINRNKEIKEAPYTIIY